MRNLNTTMFFLVLILLILNFMESLVYSTLDLFFVLLKAWFYTCWQAMMGSHWIDKLAKIRLLLNIHKNSINVILVGRIVFTSSILRSFTTFWNTNYWNLLHFLCFVMLIIIFTRILSFGDCEIFKKIIWIQTKITLLAYST